MAQIKTSYSKYKSEFRETAPLSLTSAMTNGKANAARWMSGV